MLVAPGREDLGVDRDQGADERLVVADHHALADQRVGPQPVLQHSGGDILATGRDDQLLLPAGDREVALVVQLADVAGAEPAVTADRLRGGGLVVPVAAEHHVAPEQHLAVVGDPDRDPGYGLADRADLEVLRQPHGAGGRGLGQAVALVDRDADAAEEVTQPGAQRGTAEDRGGAAAAERGAQLAVHQPVEQGVLEPQGKPGTAGVLRLAPCHRGRLGNREDPALALLACLLHGAVVDLLEHPWHREHQGRPEFGQVGQQFLHVGRVADGGPRVEATDLDRPGEDVRERQEQQDLGVGVEQLRSTGAHGPDLGQQVAVGQLAALGAPRGARGVDQSGHVVGADLAAAGVHVVVGDLGAQCGQLVDCARGAVELPYVGQVGQPVAHRVDGGAVRRGLDHDGPGPRVGQDPLDLLGRRRLVHRHGDAAGGEDGEVHQRPLVAGAGQQPHPVAALQAAGQQALGHREHLRREFLCRHVEPATVHSPAVDDATAEPFGRGEHHVGQVVLVRHRRGGGDAELTHVDLRALTSTAFRNLALISP